MTLGAVEAALAPHHLAVFGGFHPEEGGTLLMVGPSEPGFHAHFTAQPEARDGRPDPLDRWSRRVLTEVAEALGAEPKFPFGEPRHPFMTWATRTGRAWHSPVMLLVHETAGLLVSYRGALAFAGRLELPPTGAKPCNTCAAPCLTACPPRALTAEGYDVPACKAHVASPEGTACRTGCLVRRACPVSQAYPRAPEMGAFHMEAFL